MAKMLGQDLFTQAEFDEFKATQFDRLKEEQEATFNLIGELLKETKQATHRATLALVVSVVGLGVSLFALFA